jgi:hypothetical protein
MKMPTSASGAALVVHRSGNTKTGNIAATWTSRATCPKRCPLNGICYPHKYPAAVHTNRLDKSKACSPYLIALDEAKMIGDLPGTKPLRLSVYGDHPTRISARVVADACRRYTAKHGQPCYGYTHAWDIVKPRDWTGVSMFASCETPAEVALAKAMGWATVLILLEGVKYDVLKLIPCRYHIDGTQCIECRRCMNARKCIRNDETIALSVHGRGKLSDSVRKVVYTKLQLEGVIQ